jgi:peptidoglycan/xylan/chitin deacetylase (PgdA/CDA1 family)
MAVAAVMVLAVTAGVGLWSSGLGGDAEKTVEAQPSSAAPSPTPSPAMAEIAGQVEAVPLIVPLSQRNPITGPDRPPLPDDEAGPYGSRRTTGTYEVALTFDDGPDPRYTPDVLALLRQYRIKATFCVIGVNVIEFPHLVRAIAADGHTLCNHSWLHDTGLGIRSHSTIASDMARTNEAIRAAAPGSRVSYFRHPGGAWTQAAVNSARQQGMTSLHWDVDPRDWLRPGPRAISNTVTGSTQPGSIVLLHDGGGDRLGTVEALRSILPNLASRLRLVALPPGIDPPRLHGIHLPIHAGQQ